jgi:hypothetical protein
MLQKILEHFQRLQKACGSSMQHECDMGGQFSGADEVVEKEGRRLQRIAK